MEGEHLKTGLQKDLFLKLGFF